MPRNPAPKAKKPKAKKPKLESKPSLEAGEERDVPKVAEPPAPPVQVIERRIETVTIKIPLGEPPHRIDKFHLDVLLNGDHAHTIARLRQALRDTDARTADGHKVDTRPDVLRWLLEQIAL